MERIFRYQADQPVLLRNYLRHLGYSKDLITALKKAPCDIRVNGVHQNVDYSLKAGDLLEVHLVEQDEVIQPVAMALDIFYEDEDLLIINKPPFCSVHPSRAHPLDSLANGVVWYYSQKGQSIVFHCINRLDRDTSGLVLIAKNRLAASLMKKAGLKKTYQALLEGRIETDLCVDQPITAGDEPMKRKVSPDGLAALTRLHPLKYIESLNATLVQCRLEHGRTHQIRVHCQFIQHPLLGDWLYNPNNHQLPRQGLHCDSLSFIHPFTHQPLHFESPLPDDLRSAIEPYGAK